MKRNVPPPDLAEIAERVGVSLNEVKDLVALIDMGIQPVPRRVDVTEDGKRRFYFIERRGLGRIVTKSGPFWLYHFTVDDEWRDYLVAVKAANSINYETLNPQFAFRNQDLLLRIDSGCVTGQVFRDLTCDCLQQLEATLDAIGAIDEGIVINIPKQDGRGMGLSFKLATLWLQEELHLDTVEAASLLSPDSVIDERTYSGVIAVLRFLEIPASIKIKLATNNPDKKSIFSENGYTVDSQVPVVIEPTEHTIRHLSAKQKVLGHINLVKG